MHTTNNGYAQFQFHYKTKEVEDTNQINFLISKQNHQMGNQTVELQSKYTKNESIRSKKILINLAMVGLCQCPKLLNLPNQLLWKILKIIKKLQGKVISTYAFQCSKQFPSYNRDISLTRPIYELQFIMTYITNKLRFPFCRTL